MHAGGRAEESLHAGGGGRPGGEASGGSPERVRDGGAPRAWNPRNFQIQVTIIIGAGPIQPESLAVGPIGRGVSLVSLVSLFCPPPPQHFLNGPRG